MMPLHASFAKGTISCRPIRTVTNFLIFSLVVEAAFYFTKSAIPLEVMFAMYVLRMRLLGLGQYNTNPVGISSTHSWFGGLLTAQQEGFQFGRGDVENFESFEMAKLTLYFT